jgi:hypothetical protein
MTPETIQKNEKLLEWGDKIGQMNGPISDNVRVKLESLIDIYIRDNKIPHSTRQDLE